MTSQEQVEDKHKDHAAILVELGR